MEAAPTQPASGSPAMQPDSSNGMLRHRAFCHEQAVSCQYHAASAGPAAGLLTPAAATTAAAATAASVASISTSSGLQQQQQSQPTPALPSPSPTLPHSTSPPPHPSSSPARPKLLVCHDMRGGYLGDRFVQHTGDPSQFSLWHWQCVDTLVYFSHHMVTVPPPSWTAAAHRNGVQVLHLCFEISCCCISRVCSAVLC